MAQNMIFRSKCRVVSLIVVAVVSASHPVPIVRAQKEKEAEQRQELEKKTLALLNEVASGAWGLKLPENRVFVMASAADLLWQFDEKRARSFYWDALNSLSAPRSITTPVRNDAEKLSKEDRQKFAQDYFAVYRLRQKILRQIARRDPQLAMEMLRATRQVPPRQTNPSEWQYPDDSELEQEIASAATENDPAKALQIARQSLAKGLTLQSLTPLYNLLAKHPEKATQYAGDIIDKLRTTNIAADLRASLIGLHLLVMSRSRDGNRSPAEPAIAEEKRLNLNDEQRRDLVELLTDAALSASPNSTLLNEMSDVMPDATDSSAHPTSAVPPTMRSAPTMKASRHWRRVRPTAGTGTARPPSERARNTDHAYRTPPATRKRAPVMRNGGTVSIAYLMARYVEPQMR